MTARFLIADVFDGLASLEADSVDLIVSSPPFLALRSYLPADHPDKAKEIGSEPTPADFLDTLLDVVEACDRVLAPHGSLCFELGDTFSGSGGAGGDYGDDGLREGQPFFDGSALRSRSSAGWPDAKSLCGIPQAFMLSLAYGYNMLRPERTTPRWRVRNLVVWARPNPPVGALGDKFRPATSYVTVACKSGKRYFDLDAVRHPAQQPEPAGDRSDRRTRVAMAADGAGDPGHHGANPAGAPPLDYWVLPTHGYPGSHYATFPPDLVVKPVASMCPQKVCRVCGEPSRRITSEPEYVHDGKVVEPVWNATGGGSGRATGADVSVAGTSAAGEARGATRTTETLGWTDCGCTCPTCGGSGEFEVTNHDFLSPKMVDVEPCPDCEGSNWRAGVVLDPFAGSGTTLAVATGHGRDAIGIDLDERNAELALDRVGPMFLTVETRDVPACSERGEQRKP